MRDRFGCPCGVARTCWPRRLWKVRATRSRGGTANGSWRSLRVYTISDQDDSGPWIRKTFPDLFYIASPGVTPAARITTRRGAGSVGDNFHGRFAGADFSSSTIPGSSRTSAARARWAREYPRCEFLMEGDTPSFLNLINNGLDDPEHPDWGGWGGRYEFYTPRDPQMVSSSRRRDRFWTDAEDEVLGVDGNWHTANQATIWRWRSPYQNDFAARMDWTIKPYKEANHPPVAETRASGRADRQARATRRP